MRAFLLLLCARVAAAGTADGLADALAANAPAGEVGVRVRSADAPQLAATLEGLIVARIGHARRFAGEPAAARAAGLDYWLDVDVTVDRAAGEVTALGRLVPVAHDLWAEAAGRKPFTAVATAPFARAKLDAELRAYLGLPAARPRKLVFRPLKAELDLGAPILALAGGDVDGDGKSELAALTPDEVVVLDVDRDAVAVRYRVALEGAAPVPRPRQPIGTIVVAGGEIRARSSEHAQGVVLRDGKKVGAPKGYASCAGDLELVAGTVTFVRDRERWVGLACAGDVVAAVDAAGTLRLSRGGQIAGVGFAFQIADLDRDGALEAVVSAYRPQGTGDALSLYRIGADGARLLRQGAQLPGGVAAIAAGDFDGDGAVDWLAAVGAGGTRYDLWLLD
ncbi:MAG TPA: VCBS repeat-containing protein [Haliangiales bacterium]|nr:VCBS repeat-containing protein [Haliangiales bacterium]